MSYNTLVFFPTTYNPPKWFDRERLPELLGEKVGGQPPGYFLLNIFLPLEVHYDVW